MLQKFRPITLGAILAAAASLAGLSAGNRPQSSHAASPAIAEAIAPIIRQHDVPGMVAAIVDASGTLEIGCAGVRARGSAQAISSDDRMHLGSCTKSMTATMIATLVQDGVLSFDTTVGQVFADMGDRMHKDWKDVPLRLLLCNRSGAPGDITKHNLWRELWQHSGTATAARRMLAERVLSQQPEASPDSRYIYSNAGFAIAGAMAEAVTGESFEDLMAQRLFEPLDMASAGFGAPGRAAVIDQPRGHKGDGTAVPPGPAADNPVGIAPAGLVHCSVIDWSKYIALHLRGPQGTKTPILDAAAFTTLHGPAHKPAGEQSPDYAMGWGVTRRPWAGDGAAGGLVLTHTGSNTMWFAVCWLAPERDFAVLVACNKGGEASAKACDQAAAAMIKRHRERLRWP